jgi:hypothetical protein
MNGLEEQADNAKARELFWKPLSWLGTIRPTSANDDFDPALWETFVSTTLGLEVPILTALPRFHHSPLAKCGYKKFCMDFHGDHTSICTAHSGATKAHDWMVRVLGPLFRTAGHLVRETSLLLYYGVSLISAMLWVIPNAPHIISGGKFRGHVRGHVTAGLGAFLCWMCLQHKKWFNAPYIYIHTYIYSIYTLSCVAQERCIHIYREYIYREREKLSLSLSLSLSLCLSLSLYI